MFDKDNLHWSFNHSRHRQEEFGEELVAVLHRYVFGGSEKDARSFNRNANERIVSTYTILPNFWRGYQRQGEEPRDNITLAIGRTTLSRYLDNEGIIRYTWQSRNETSGENLTIEFQCKDCQWRELLNSWHIKANNDAGYLYRGISCDGHIHSSPGGIRQVTLVASGSEIHSETYSGTAPLTCTHALFDVIPRIHAEEVLFGTSPPGDRIELAIIDDLEKLKAPVYIGFLESINFKISGPPEDYIFDLAGYYVYGDGMVPSYWWVDSYENIVISTTTFQTHVLKSVIAGEDSGPGVDT
jgi:hypothetical protein